jgi:hypothetical protein
LIRQIILVRPDQFRRDAGLVSADFAASQMVTFNAYGRWNNSCSIVLTSGSDTTNVVVDAATGRATVQ